jgi:uncharacterized protein
VRVVLDTNVILAGLATRGLCEAVVALCLNQHEIFLSIEILSELRKHLSGKFKMPAARVQEVVAFLDQQVQLVRPAPVPLEACRDPDDAPILGTAVAALAECLITGDKDLLDLRNFQGIPILTPRAFYDQTKK